MKSDVDIYCTSTKYWAVPLQLKCSFSKYRPEFFVQLSAKAKSTVDLQINLNPGIINLANYHRHRQGCSASYFGSMVTSVACSTYVVILPEWPCSLHSILSDCGFCAFAWRSYRESLEHIKQFHEKIVANGPSGGNVAQQIDTCSRAHGWSGHL